MFCDQCAISIVVCDASGKNLDQLYCDHYAIKEDKNLVPSPAYSLTLLYEMVNGVCFAYLRTNRYTRKGLAYGC